MTQVLDGARILILNVLNYSFILMFYKSRMCIYHRTTCINTPKLWIYWVYGYIGCVRLHQNYFLFQLILGSIFFSTMTSSIINDSCSYFSFTSPYIHASNSSCKLSIVIYTLMILLHFLPRLLLGFYSSISISKRILIPLTHTFHLQILSLKLTK